MIPAISQVQKRNENVLQVHESFKNDYNGLPDHVIKNV